MDFTIKIYRIFLQSLISQGYSFQTFEGFLVSPNDRSIILRHDVDLMPRNSLAFAKIQHEHGIKGVYYFRAVPQSWDEKIIREIADMGHEIGYHYESLTTCRGDFDKSISDFERNLNALRQLVSVRTICMHGSPMSKYDSKDLWKVYNYQDYGIVGEPYFDVNFSKVFYMTDTGRRWNGERVSVRDKVNSGFDLSFANTGEIIATAERGGLPQQIMLTFHPQRWNDDRYLWTKELLAQNAKNLVKRYVYKRS